MRPTLWLATVSTLPLGGVALAEPPSAPAIAPAQEVRIVIDGGYRPSRVVVTAGVPIRLVFLRREYNSCTKEVIFPTLGVRRALPVGEEVAIDLPAQAAGEVAFHCGMKMVRGKLVVEAKR